MQQRWFLFLVVFFIMASCHNNDNVNSDEPIQLKKAADFNADLAYEHVKMQLSFGPRTAGSAAQKNCAAYIESEVKKYCDTVYIQNAIVLQPISNIKYPCINIVGSINPDALYRILILAHWDSRPWADQDSVDKNKAILGADDGASGVAVMLEMARAIKESGVPLEDVGVDFLFVDVEDVGKTEWTELSYSLGTQYWANNMHLPGYKANYGICLDMVGARNAKFLLEGFSKQYASDIQRNIWDIGNRLGYSAFFNYGLGGAITDDHVIVNEIAKIPTVDIINLPESGSFGRYWHTHNDNLDVIDKKTLKAVGQTVLQVIYQE